MPERVCRTFSLNPAFYPKPSPAPITAPPPPPLARPLPGGPGGGNGLRGFGRVVCWDVNTHGRPPGYTASTLPSGPGFLEDLIDTFAPEGF